MRLYCAAILLLAPSARAAYPEVELLATDAGETRLSEAFSDHVDLIPLVRERLAGFGLVQNEDFESFLDVVNHEMRVQSTRHDPRLLSTPNNTLILPRLIHSGLPVTAIPHELAARGIYAARTVLLAPKIIDHMQSHRGDLDELGRFFDQAVRLNLYPYGPEAPVYTNSWDYQLAKNEWYDKGALVLGPSHGQHVIVDMRRQSLKLVLGRGENVNSLGNHPAVLRVQERLDGQFLLSASDTKDTALQSPLVVDPRTTPYLSVGRSDTLTEHLSLPLSSVSRLHLHLGFGRRARSIDIKDYSRNGTLVFTHSFVQNRITLLPTIRLHGTQNPLSANLHEKDVELVLGQGQPEAPGALSISARITLQNPRQFQIELRDPQGNPIGAPLSVDLAREDMVEIGRGEGKSSILKLAVPQKYEDVSRIQVQIHPHPDGTIRIVDQGSRYGTGVRLQPKTGSPGS